MRMYKDCLVSMLLLVSLASITLHGHDTYKPFAISKEDIAAVLASEVTVPVSAAVPLKPDIMFACADIKYKDGSLKVCELGDGIYMSFRTAQVTLNDHVQDAVSPYWGIFWHYLAQFNLPLWHVDDLGAHHAMAMNVFAKLGGKHVSSLKDLQADTLFQKLSKRQSKKITQLNDYKGIIVYRAKQDNHRDNDTVKAFKRNFPDFLWVNLTARDYVKRKDNTYKLFADAKLDDFIPRFNIYPTTYSSSLVQQINHDFPNSNRLIIKPVYSSLAMGVNLIDKKDLDSFLKLILKDYQTINPREHRRLAFWRHHPKTFFVSEYVPSKTIYKDDTPRDPTMRVVFMMHHDQGTIHCTVIAGFWKIPVYALDDANRTLTDKHITIAHSGAYYSGILADKKDWAEIKGALEAMLPKLYQTMLEQNTKLP